MSTKKDTAKKPAQPAAKGKASAKKTEEFNPEDYVKLSVSKEDVLEMKRAFDIFDDDNSGTVDPSEITKAFEKLGLMGKSRIIYQVLAELDEDQSGAIDFNEFFRFVTSRVSEKDKKEEILKGLEEMEFGGLVCTDKEALDR